MYFSLPPLCSANYSRAQLEFSTQSSAPPCRSQTAPCSLPLCSISNLPSPCALPSREIKAHVVVSFTRSLLLSPSSSGYSRPSRQSLPDRSVAIIRAAKLSAIQFPPHEAKTGRCCFSLPPSQLPSLKKKVKMKEETKR